MRVPLSAATPRGVAGLFLLPGFDAGAGRLVAAFRQAARLTRLLTASNHLGYNGHQMMSRPIEHEIDAADICERLVGITTIYLQNFVSRGLYGLRASVKPGKVRTQRRLFSREDVFGIALVWLLFESGLRGDPIVRILNDIAGTRKANANLAAKRLLDSKTECLLVVRQPRTPTKSPLKKPDQRVRTVRQSDLAEIIGQHPGADLLVIPVGHKFEDIRKRMEILF